jgi:hypothetical protein
MKRMRLLVRDKNGLHWSFAVHGTQESLDAWQEAGFDAALVVNTIPEAVVDLGLARAWCAMQDLWNLQNPWG